MAQSSLDSNPATAADWSSGHWIRYEDTLGSESDIGGTDCNFKPFVAPQADAAPPLTTASCVAAVIVTLPPATQASRGGGGGGSVGLVELAIAVMSCVASGMRRTRARRRSAG
jgi:hypothetical protein